MSVTKFHCWLDPIIERQAKAYGLSRDKFEVLMSGAAAHQELVDEPSNEHEMHSLQSGNHAEPVSE